MPLCWWVRFFLCVSTLTLSDAVPTLPPQESLPDDREELDLFLRTEISAVDVAKDVILSQLKDEVRANHDALIQGMTVVQEVDFDIVRAQIHVKNGRRLLENAKADLLMK